MSSPQILKLIARFVHADSGEPLDGPGLRVRFYDLDILRDDLLGESALSREGMAEVVCSSSDFQSGLIGKAFDRLKEKKPDIYCEVVDSDATAIYRSSVTWNIDPTRVDEVTKTSRPTIDLGTFRFRRGEGLAHPGPGGVRRPLM